MASPGQAPATGWADLPRPFWYLWAGTLLNRLGSFVLPFLALYLTRSRGFSVAEAGLVLGVAGAGAALSQPLGGILADRVGRRRTMVGGLVACSFALIGVGLDRGVVLLCAAVFVYGVSLDVFRPASQASMTDMLDPADRRRAFALVFWAINLGFAVASVVGGLLAARAFWALFALDAATCLGYAVLVLRGVPETRPVRVSRHHGSIGTALRDPLLVGVVGGTFLQAVVYAQAFSTLPLVFSQDRLGPSRYGQAIAVNGVLIVVLQPLLLRRLARGATGPLLLAGALLEGLGFGMTTFADTLLQHMSAIAVWTLGEILGAGLLSALVAAIAPSELRGRYMGLYGASYGMAAMVAPLLGTQVLARYGEGVLWSGCLATSALSGVVLLRVSRAAQGRSAEVRAAVR